MVAQSPVACACLALAFSGTTLYAQAQPPEQRPAEGIIKEDRIIAGGPKDSLEVRHLVLQGTNEAIGRTLAQLGRGRYQVQPQASRDPLRTRAQRRYIEKNFRMLYERMRGVASAFGRRLEDDSWNFSELGFIDLKAGCSVIYLPPSLTTAGKGIVSRDYDFTTGSIRFGPLQAGQLHPTARPYLLELHPDHGYASLAMVAYDLLSGVIDGINSEGLTVALLADDELALKYALEPTGEPAVGLGVLQTLRLLLDTCATATEAKEALLQTKQYYEFVPVHYLVADRFGNAFVWEYSHAHNKEFIIENPNRPLITTNFSLHRYLDRNRPPTADQARKVCPRYCLLTEQLAGRTGKISEAFLKETHKKVDAVAPKSGAGLRPPNRTLWHALYFPEQCRLRISFYLRDEAVPDQPNKARIVRSDYVEFRVSPTDVARQELDQLQGEWQMISGRQDGVDTPREAAKVMRCTVVGTQVTFLRDGNAVEQVCIALDPSQKPKALDATLHQGQVARGIYKLDNDVLTLCYVHLGKERPTEFSAKAGSGALLSVWKRAKK
jgi:uncharacterized protein (TIGR03067 family)